MMHIREWFNFIFLALLLGSYALLALVAFARALASLVQHRHNAASALTEEEEGMMLNDTPSAIILSHEIIPSYVSGQRQSVTSQ